MNSITMTKQVLHENDDDRPFCIRLCNEYYSTHVRYIPETDSYSNDLKLKRIDPSRMLITTKPLQSGLPDLICMMKTKITEQRFDIDISASETVSIENICRFVDNIRIATNTLQQIIDTIKEYFPETIDVFQERSTPLCLK